MESRPTALAIPSLREKGVLEISQAVEYGIRGVMYMAQKDDDRPALVREIAEAEDIPVAFLHKIFQRMTRTRLLSARRGVGYTFAKPPEEITLLDVVHAIEGPVHLRSCVLDKDYCERSGRCKLVNFWTELQGELVEKLRGVTIRDLVSG